jgi:hypothetical protein
VEEALATYSTALEVYPNHIPTMQAMSRLQLRHNRADDRTPGMLKEIAMGGETQQWRDWAQWQLVKANGSTDSLLKSGPYSVLVPQPLPGGHNEHAHHQRNRSPGSPRSR